jgi:hypothetical protein
VHEPKDLCTKAKLAVSSTAFAGISGLDCNKSGLPTTASYSPCGAVQAGCSALINAARERWDAEHGGRYVDDITAVVVGFEHSCATAQGHSQH